MKYIVYVYTCIGNEKPRIHNWPERSLVDHIEGAEHYLAMIKDAECMVQEWANEDELFLGSEYHLTEERFAEFILMFS